MWREPMRRRTRELLDAFVEGADELVCAQEHMQGLLAAVMSLTQDLSLEAVLDRVIRSACELVGARYAALGVIGEDQQLSHFITVGVDDESARLIGELPTGHGVLGQLIRDPRPLRLNDLGSHPMAAGFPANHPPMSSFLGVPLRVRDTVFGNLYVTEKEDGKEFTPEDEDLMVALAAAAGIAIQNARLFEDSKRRQRWLEAGMDLTDRLIGTSFQGDARDELWLIAERALHVSESVLAVIASAESSGGSLRCAVSVGVQSLPAGEQLNLASADIGRVLETGQSAFLRAGEVLGPKASGKLGRALVVSLGRQGGQDGLLILVRVAGAPGYPESDLESSAVFGSRIGLALDLTRANRLREDQVLFADRDRIARDLHDLVIQRLFAAGLNMQSLRRYVADPVENEMIVGVTRELDETISELRNTIFSLRDERPERELLSERVLRAVQDGARDGEFTPKVQLSGPVDEVVSEAVLEQLLPVLSEGLSNAVRHSGADEICISLTARDDAVELLIADNGRGFENPDRVSGLENMRRRAAALGGHCSIESAPGGGTRLLWSAPTTG